MINPKELRFDNWVRIEGNAKPLVPAWSTKVVPEFWRIRHLGTDAGLYEDGNKDDVRGWYSKEYKYLEGIPLTPEILEQCGQDWTINDTRGWQLMQTDGGYLLAVAEDHFMNTPVIKYLHQLQNLYYSLTGQELEVKQLA